MTTIHLGFKAFDSHELLCHFVAVKTGLYKKEKLDVELIDITFTPETELPKDWLQASCGAALGSALKSIPQRVLFVATDRPMFWIYSRSDINELEGLSGRKLATFPPIAPPHHLANIIISKAGAENVTLHPARDDTARLGLLQSGNVDAAVISSAIAPPHIMQAGINMLSFIGDEIRIPTTGLAVDQSFLEQEKELMQTLVGIHRESLNAIHQNPEIVATVLKESFNIPAEYAEETAKTYQSYYTRDGTTSPEIAQNAVDSLRKSLNISDAVDWQDVYLFTL